MQKYVSPFGMAKDSECLNQSRKIKKLLSATGGPLFSFGKALLNRHRGPVDLDDKSPVLNTNERETSLCLSTATDRSNKGEVV